MIERMEKLRSLPSVSDVLNHPVVAALSEKHGHALATYAVRHVVGRARAAVLNGAELRGDPSLISDVVELAGNISGSSLRPVINATGVVLHTNLGRAPLGRAVMEDIAAVAEGYCNLEFDLKNARRGNRNTHLAELLKFLTSAEEVVVVNNNAAGILLTLSTLAAGREVVVSRGELIEIGGSFRIPEVMKASGAILVEVGTTNRTHLADYEAAIGPQTALIFKAHKSNYAIRGFTREASVRELSELAHAHDLPMVYDIGSGLLRKSIDSWIANGTVQKGDPTIRAPDGRPYSIGNAGLNKSGEAQKRDRTRGRQHERQPRRQLPKGLPLENEPDVRSAIQDGADLVTFSADKLLGGPQAGVVAGRAELVRRLAEAPLMRAVRVGKLTLAAMTSVCRHYLDEESLLTSNPALAMLARPLHETKRLAAQLLSALKEANVEARRIESTGQCGGGALPEVRLPSVAVEILPTGGKTGCRQTFAERLFHRLLQMEPPVLGVLREGKLLLDVLAVFPEQIGLIAKTVSEAIQRDAQQ